MWTHQSDCYACMHDAVKYCCRICNKTFETWQGYTDHRKRHQGQFPFQCKICEQGFMSKVHYGTHMNKHKQSAPAALQHMWERFLLKLRLQKTWKCTLVSREIKFHQIIQPPNMPIYHGPIVIDHSLQWPPRLDLMCCQTLDNSCHCYYEWFQNAKKSFLWGLS